MAQRDTGQQPGDGRKGLKRKALTVLPGYLGAHLQSRHLITTLRLKPTESTAAQALRGSGTAGQAAGGAAGTAASDKSSSSSLTYVPVKTLPLIFAQRKRHLQQQKPKAQHAEPYQRREGEGLLALPEDVLLKVVCLLTHDELKPLFQVCKALRTTLRNAVAYHFNYSTPSRPVEDQAPPALGERQRRPARTNMHQVMSRLSRGGRIASGRGSGGSFRSTAPRALDFADASTSTLVSSRA